MTRINASCNPRRPNRLLRLGATLSLFYGLMLMFFGLAVANERETDQPRAAQTDANPQTAATLTRPHLPSDKIAAVYRTLPQAPPSENANPEHEPGREGDQEHADGNQAAAVAPSEDVADLVDQLGSTEFAAREQATGKLREMGKSVLPTLRETAQEHPDLEVRMRASDVADGIAGGETAGRIDAFLTGKDVHLDGWIIAQQILGDGVRIRELFVDFLMRHGAAASALEGSTQQRSAAFDATIISIRKGMFVERRLPTESDLIALLLLANDHDMPISNVEEDAIFTTLGRDATNKLMTDAQLSGPFRALLGGWISRADISNRQKMLWFSLTWDMDETLALAIATLSKTDQDPVTLAMAMQAVARFGNKTDIPSVARLLTDERPASEQQYSQRGMLQAQVRDAAAATVVLLNDQSLADFGMNENAIHPKYGFIVQEIGFPVEDPKVRQLAIEKVRSELFTPK